MRFELIQKIERRLRCLGRIGLLFMRDAYLVVRRHGAMVESVDLSHTFSSRHRRPQKDQHARPNSEKVRMEILQLISILVGSIGRGNVKIRLSWLLARRPESGSGKMPQIPRQWPGIGSDHGDTWRRDGILGGQLFDLRRQAK